MPSRGRGDTVTATWTVVSPYLTQAAAEASSVVLPTSMVRGRPHKSMVQVLYLGNCLCLMIVDISDSPLFQIFPNVQQLFST